MKLYDALSLARQLSAVTRYSRDFSIRRESVLEHTGFCAIYCLSLATQMKKTYPGINIGLVLTKAILHDIEEAETGDINRTAKYYSPETKAAFQIQEEAAAKRICAEVFGGSWALGIWQEAKDSSLEGQIVAVSDLAAVAYHVHNELFVLGNRSFRRVQEEALGFVQAKIESTDQNSLIKEELARLKRIMKGDLPI